MAASNHRLMASIKRMDDFVNGLCVENREPHTKKRKIALSQPVHDEELFVGVQYAVLKAASTGVKPKACLEVIKAAMRAGDAARARGASKSEQENEATKVAHLSADAASAIATWVVSDDDECQVTDHYYKKYVVYSEEFVPYIYPPEFLRGVR